MGPLPNGRFMAYQWGLLVIKPWSQGLISCGGSFWWGVVGKAVMMKRIAGQISLRPFTAAGELSPICFLAYKGVSSAPKKRTESGLGTCRLICPGSMGNDVVRDGSCVLLFEGFNHQVTLIFFGRTKIWPVRFDPWKEIFTMSETYLWFFGVPIFQMLLTTWFVGFAWTQNSHFCTKITRGPMPYTYQNSSQSSATLELTSTKGRQFWGAKFSHTHTYQTECWVLSLK